MKYIEELCEYYNIKPEEAQQLGMRSSGRKPIFPKSVTCQNPPQGLTFEQIWDGKPRDTIQQKMDFYKDLGPWQVFRQSVYRDPFPFEMFFKYFNFGSDDLTIVEYGCGAGTFTNHIINQTGDVNGKVKFILVDVPGEHLEFAKWRLKKKAPNTTFEYIEVTEKEPLPNFKDKLDFVLMLDVLEHVPNPIDVINNIADHSSKEAILVETWIDQSDGFGYSDLEESVIERPEGLKLLDKRYDVIEKINIDNIKVRKLKNEN